MYKPYSDSYLMSLTKEQIIELLRVAEHNFFATEATQARMDSRSTCRLTRLLMSGKH